MSTSSHIEVRPVSGRQERRRFLTFPWQIYRDDPTWVPPILSDHAARLRAEKNPLFEHGEAELYMAWRGRAVVGTVGVAIDHQTNTYLNEPIAAFGFFETIDDDAVAGALLDRAVGWARSRGAALLRGPQSFGSSDEPGILIEGWETPRGLLMGWAPPYYRGVVERYGFEKFEDGLAYRIALSDCVDQAGGFEPPGNLRRLADYVRRRYGDRCRIRPARMASWESDLETARVVFNRALSVLHDFVPSPPEDWMRMFESIRPLVEEDLVIFVELDGEPVGFGLGLPDITMALWHCNGLRTPLDYARLWWHSRHLPGVSLKIMAMVPEAHGMGLDALIYMHIGETCWRKGYEWVDMSLTGDGNPTTNKLAARVGAHVDKRYRVYQLRLDS